MHFEEINNPYTLQFSYIPPQFIERTLVTNELINNFTTYRKRLIDSGIVDGKQYGFLALKLPRFGEFIDMCPAP